MTTGNYTIRECLPSPINSGSRDFAIGQTMDLRYFLFYSDRNNGWKVYASNLVNGIYQPAEVLPLPFSTGYTLAENDKFLYYHNTGQYVGNEIYYKTRIISCDDFAITELQGEDAIINPLPLAGQHVDLTATINSSQPVTWSLAIDGAVIDKGSGTTVQTTWNGRNSEGLIEPGTYILVLSADTSYGNCHDERSIPVTIDWNDDCKLEISFGAPEP